MRAAIYTTSVAIKYFIEEVLVLYIVQKQEEVDADAFGGVVRRERF